MNPALTAILAGIFRQLILGISGGLVAYGVKMDDSNVEWLTGVALALVTMSYSSAKKWWLHKEIADLKDQTSQTPK